MWKEKQMDKIHLPKEIYERLDLKENEEIEIVDLAADSFTIRKINARKSDKAPKWFIIPNHFTNICICSTTNNSHIAVRGKPY